MDSDSFASCFFPCHAVGLCLGGNKRWALAWLPELYVVVQPGQRWGMRRRGRGIGSVQPAGQSCMPRWVSHQAE